MPREKEKNLLLLHSVFDHDFGTIKFQQRVLWKRFFFVVEAWKCRFENDRDRVFDEHDNAVDFEKAPFNKR